MESANLHHHQQHQLQGQLVGSPSPSLSAPSAGYGAPTSPHAWTQNISLSTENESSLSNSVIQNLGFQWNIHSNNAAALSFTHDHQIKEEEELSNHFPKFTEMLLNSTSTTSSTIDQNSHLSSTNFIKDEQKYMNDLSEKLLLKTISSGFPINPSQIYSTFGTSIPSRGNFSQIYPSVNISDLNRSSISGSFDMNFQALDLLTSTRFSGSFGQPCHDNNLGIYKDNISYDLDHLQQLNHMPSCNPNKVSPFTTNDITEAKRANSSLMEPKPALQAAPKKSRLETRSSCPPFKVRKEKLGDRIAALQQLVAPFGKTDTASVLMEAIGYIKFLQNQVETLSVPYMKLSRNNSSRTTQLSTTEKGNEERKKDLRSRGLCLVPLSCMSYVTGEAGVGGGGGGIWPPPFGGGT